MSWESRIVRTGFVSPEELLANPWNVKVHGKAQQDAMDALLCQVGWVAPVIVSERTGYVIDGHMRVMLALREGITLIPVAYVDLEPDEEAVALALLNRTASMAVVDPVALEKALAGVRTDDVTLGNVLSDFAKSAGLLEAELPSGPAPAGPVEPDGPPDDPKPVRIQIGEFKLAVEQAEFASWMAALMKEAGPGKPAALEIVLRRIGLEVSA